MTGVAVNVTEVPGQIVVADGATVTDGTTRSFTVIVIWLLVTVGDDGQIAFVVITTVTLSVFTKELLEKVGLFVPTSTPFTFHWYDGFVPPFVGVAVNVTDVPAQIVDPGLALIRTEGVTVGFRVNVMLKGVPVQLPDFGVTTYVTDTGEVVEFVSAPVENPAWSVPPASPVTPATVGAGQLYVVPAGILFVPVKSPEFKLTLAPLQIAAGVWLAILGLGLTVTVIV